jgi:predicted PurR-regulated permease PerM
METESRNGASSGTPRFAPFASRIVPGLAVASVFALVAYLAFRALDLLLLLFAGYLLAILLRWGGERVERIAPVHPKIALVAAIAAFFLLISMFFVFLAPIVQRQALDISEQIPEYIARAEVFLLRQSWGEEILRKTKNPEELLEEGRDVFPEFLKRVIGAFSSTFGALLNMAFILVIGIYLAFQPSVYVAGILRLVPPRRRERTRRILGRMAETTRGWLLGQAVSMSVLGIVVGAGLWLIGVPNAMALGLLAAVMTFVPNLGPVLAFVPAILVALSRGTMMAVSVTLFYVAVQTLEGNFLTPMVQQRVLSVPAALILSTQILLFDLMGFLGVVLAMPLLACAMVLIQMVYVEDFLGDRMSEPVETTPETEAEG